MTRRLALVLLLSLTYSIADARPPERPFDRTGSDFVARISERLDTQRTLRARYSGGPDVRLAPRFLVVYDQQLRLNAPPWATEYSFAEAFELAQEAWDATQPDRVKALMVFSAFDVGGDLFYLHLANDTRGLGEGDATEIFDRTPDSQLDGYIWMGDPRVLSEAGSAYFREGFVHEIAHRWSAYAKIDHPRLPSDALRGRQSSHWHYLADTEMSPMEGNNWEQRGDLFVTDYDVPPELRFSPLDLYLMGVLPPAEVPPFHVLRDARVVSPGGFSINETTPPAHRTNIPVEVQAQPVEVTIDHVIGGSGARVPAARASELPVEWPIGIVIISRGLQTNPIPETLLRSLDRQIERLSRDFEIATDGRMRLVVEVEGGSDAGLVSPCKDVGCEVVISTPEPNKPGSPEPTPSAAPMPRPQLPTRTDPVGCTASMRIDQTHTWSHFGGLLLGALALLLRRRRV